MELNSIIFPAPSSSYTIKDLKPIIWIPRHFKKKRKETTILKKFNKFSVKASVIEKPSDPHLIKPYPELQKENQPSGHRVVLKKNLSTNTLHSQIIGPQTQGGISLQPPSISDSTASMSKDLLSAIPCLYMEYSKGSDKILIYFHGNAEDIGYSFELADSLRRELKVNVISVEYPGYGIYKGQPSAEQILMDSEIVFDYLTLELNVDPSRILLFGRSIGSGPATHLAANRKPGAIILMSPYTCIREVVKHLTNKYVQYLVSDRFRNIDKISKVKCPIMFVHGRQDTLIPYSHSEELMYECQSISFLHVAEDMTHNAFHLQADLMDPLKKFLRKCGIEINNHVRWALTLPRALFDVPENNEIFAKKKNLLGLIYDKFIN